MADYNLTQAQVEHVHRRPAAGHDAGGFLIKVSIVRLRRCASQEAQRLYLAHPITQKIGHSAARRRSAPFTATGCPTSIEATSASMSSTVLYIANDARAVAGML